MPRRTPTWKRVEELHTKADDILSLLTAPEPEEQQPSRRTPVAATVPDSEVRWLSFSELFGVYARSRYGRMKSPYGSVGVQSILTADSQYAAITPDLARRILAETKVEDIAYKSEKTDCDNFSAYMAMRVSVMYGLNCVAFVDAFEDADPAKSNHSYCAFILHEGESVYLRAFEPQTDQWLDDVQPLVGWIQFR